jgi:NAD(P)-dependent dehydrogenase (short-subunit alcohol dehydrogenase family)
MNEVTALGRQVMFAAMDVTSRDAVTATVRAAEERFGRIAPPQRIPQMVLGQRRHG